MTAAPADGPAGAVPSTKDDDMNSTTNRAEVTITERWRGARVTWTARHERKIIAMVEQGPVHGMCDSEPLVVAIGAYFGIPLRSVRGGNPKPVRFRRKRGDDSRVVPRVAVVDVPTGADTSTVLCSRSGTCVSPATLKGVAFIEGSGWQAVCPDCGGVPGTRADGHVILVADHIAVPVCGRCSRPAVGWPASRPDLCSERRWVHCIRDPYVVLAENAAKAEAAKGKEDAEDQAA